LSTNRSTFDLRASKCVFIDFKKETKGYILLNIQSREIFVSRDVVFYELVFSYQRLMILAMKLTVIKLTIKVLL